MDFVKNINWKSVGLAIGGILITLAGSYIDDAKRKNDVRNLIHEELTAIAASGEEE